MTNENKIKTAIDKTLYEVTYEDLPESEKALLVEFEALMDAYEERKAAADKITFGNPQTREFMMFQSGYHYGVKIGGSK